MRTTIAHERQRRAGHWQKMDIHADIDQEVHNEKYCHAGAVEDLKIGGTAGCIDDDAPDEDTVEREEDQYAGEAPFFGESGKDKIGLIFRQELQARLVP